MIQDPEYTGLGDKTAICGDRNANYLEYGCLTCEYIHQTLTNYTPWICAVCYMPIILQWSFFFFFICSEICHTLEWNSHGFTCFPHPDPPSHLPLHPLPLGFPSAPGPSACLMHPTWAGDQFYPRYCTCFDAVLLKHPTLSFSHTV